MRSPQVIAERFPKVIRIELPDGEAHKDAASLNVIYDRLLTEGADRGTVMFRAGGGVVGDLSGFAAATYMRGIRFVQVPTTLLGAGRFVCRRQDGDQSSARQEHDRRVLPAPAGGSPTSRHSTRCRSANSPPASPK
jgi:hypothetical protein